MLLEAVLIVTCHTLVQGAGVQMKDNAILGNATRELRGGISRVWGPRTCHTFCRLAGLVRFLDSRY